MENKPKDKSLEINPVMTDEQIKACAIDLIGCVKIWGLTYSDAVNVASEIIDVLLEYEAENKPWKSNEKSLNKISEIIKNVANGN